MNAALGTLPFLGTLWLLAVLGAKVLEESGAKIAAALKGQSLQRAGMSVAPVRMRVRMRSRTAMRASASYRAAA